VDKIFRVESKSGDATWTYESDSSAEEILEANEGIISEETLLWLEDGFDQCAVGDSVFINTGLDSFRFTRIE
jgi:hypothetical protein